MNGKKVKLMVILMLLVCVGAAQARIKLVALPERAATVIRLDNPQWTLIEEERVLTLQKGLNKVDFSWKGVSIDADSIRLRALDHPDKVTLLSVSYPPNESALVWDISSDSDYAETVRISYLLRNIDRLITYKAIADKAETEVNLKSYLVLRNFSGEDFDKARVLLDYGEAFEQGIDHEETKRMLFLKAPKVPITKVWTFDAAKLPWDPEKLENKNVGIPVSYRIVNDTKSGLGEFALWGGKARLFQDDGHESTIFLGEDVTGMVPVGEKTELYIGDSRDIVVTQRKMKDERINLQRNNDNRVVLYDTDELITAKIENFKDSQAVLTMIQHIPGQWDMEKCNMKYKRKNAGTLEFEIKLPARTEDGPAVKELSMHYHRRNVRP
ncbi:MAG: hypothetical protein GWN67_15715 [Phycisphaerae bacterium]|nr:hypothetical protein [Phycisphaerae bacterium]NIP54150.1 hypothetical protein [Phycisphaerae bacterium]NIS53040.1 hypothetical protein [Phycisphaerae bacterium]NIU10058.1 hypothetical protein [Phycisphaerae bacterium]NIU57780.1 hypothetical protein [Phycisphaerae bacterium]